MSYVINNQDKIYNQLMASAILTDVMGTNDSGPIIEVVTVEIPDNAGLPEHSGVYIFPADIHKDEAVTAILHFQVENITSS